MKYIFPLLVSLLVGRSAYASDPSPVTSGISDKERLLLEALKDSEETIAALDKSKQDSPPPRPLTTAGNNVGESETEQILRKLTTQVESLRNKAIVEKAAGVSLQTPRKVRVQGSKTVYNYRPDGVYEVTVSPDHVTDIQLEPGETITSPPTAGDTVRWNVGVMKSGQPPSEITHIVLKALDQDIETNLVLATNARTYQLRLRSSDWHMPSVSWNYPKDQSEAIKAAMKKEAVVESAVAPEKLNFDYDIDGSDYSWKPVRVFDDGEKTFIQMPKGMRVNEAPALFLRESDSEPLLVNYRVKGDYYIVDRLFEQAELRVGTRRSVRIEAEHARKNFFQRLFD